ncbi:uncharacterized protein LOC133522657 [Cydia pomonella]|uniref:uncharacterized protein LOC133522657 n=1 Tax=Cydia pomonella TaxID=82600 RepID=UPI002ADDD6A4|nr:uncharacterized protein LOC133522657 [Cydia pomonella]
MSPNKENIMQPATLQEAINIIKFLTTSHKQEIAKLKESLQKQAALIKKLEANRKKELEFLSSELQNYEENLAISKETVTKQIADKDDIIQKQTEIIEELNRKLKLHEELSLPEINIVAPVDSNSDSGVAMDESNLKSDTNKIEAKTTRKYSRRFAESISFLRRVDFSPMKYKPCNRECTKKKDEKKSTSLDIPYTDKGLTRQLSSERVMSDDDSYLSADPVLSDSLIEPLVIRSKKMDDSMNNHFSDDGSEDTSEEVFDRVMTRSSVRRSVKANPKYKKINRTKSKLLEQVKVNIID